MRIAVAGQKTLQADNVWICWPVRSALGRRHPLSIKATRRRIRARMILSPSSASAINSARRFAVGTRSVSTSLVATASTSEGRPDSCPTSARKSPGPSSTIGAMCSQPVAAPDRRAARDEDEHAGRDLAGLEQHVASGIAPDFAEAAHALDLRRAELRQHLLATLLDHRHRPLRVIAAIGRRRCGSVLSAVLARPAVVVRLSRAGRRRSVTASLKREQRHPRDPAP